MTSRQKKAHFNILGFGCLSPLGESPVEFWDYINEGRWLWETESSSQYPDLSDYYCLRVKDFSPLKYFDEKQLHNLDNNSIYIAAAAKWAITDASVDVATVGSDRVGVSVGTSISIATSMSDFDESVFKYGSRRSQIGIFPNTVMCAPASRVSIFEHITGLNTTLSSGTNSGIDSIGYACFCLENKAVDYMVVGGSDALSDKILLGFQKEGLLFKKHENPKSNHRGAFVPSEGACVLVLQQSRRGEPEIKTFGKILAYTNGFAPFKRRDIKKRGESLAAIIKCCIQKAEFEMDNIDCFLLGSYFDIFDYQTELYALSLIGVDKANEKPIFAPKKILGECFGAFSTHVILFAVGLFKNFFSQQTLQKLEINNKPLNKETRSALLIQADSGGHLSVLLMSL